MEYTWASHLVAFEFQNSGFMAKRFSFEQVGIVFLMQWIYYIVIYIILLSWSTLFPVGH